MRKKSHILLTNWIADQMEHGGLKSHRTSFLIGSVLPDCRPSFVTRKHEFAQNFEMVASDIRRLSGTEGAVLMDSGRFWRKLGEVLHYIADYFTFPHNPVFHGSLWEHGQYEQKLKIRLKERLRNGAASDFHMEKRHFADVQALIRFVGEEHSRYLKSRHSLECDIHYIVRVCLEVCCGILQLLWEKSVVVAA